MADLIGHDIGRYHITEQLGVGGMATVYKAYDTRLERDVAIKVIRKEAFGVELLERMLKRFEREAKALAKLAHPNIVSIFDYGEHEGSPYLVMQFVQGGTLKQQMGTPVSYVEAARLLLPVAQALEYAHGRGIVHRDVKPANILITDNHDRMLSDFGIAKMLDLEEGNTLTGTNVGIGTPEYMAPEQGMGQAIDGRADIYSLGVVFYELVTGRKPYTADTPMAVVIKQINDPLPDPKLYASSLGKDAERVIYKALAKTPQDRYQTMGEFAAALEKLAGQNSGQASVSKDAPPAPQLPPRPTAPTLTMDSLAGGSITPRKKAPVWGAAAGGVILLLVLIILGMLAYPRLTMLAALPEKTAQPTALAALPSAAQISPSATDAPALGPTDKPVPTKINTAIGGPTLPPTPDPVKLFFPGTTVIYTADLSSGGGIKSRGWKVPWGSVGIKDSTLVVTQHSGILRSDAIGEGFGAVVLFKISAGTDANIVFYSNPGMSDKYIGIKATPNGLATLAGAGMTALGGEPLAGDLVIKVDHWYFALVRVNPRGEFYLQVRENDIPYQYSEKTLQLGQDWAGGNWYGSITTNLYNKGEIDVQSYQELRFH